MSNEKLRLIQLYTDGACSGNPGPGGWAFLLRDGPTGKENERAGWERETTNNRMELQAVIEGLTALGRRCHVEIYSDSKYVLQGLETWMAGWKKRNWKKAGGGDVKNKELWLQLDQLIQKHSISFHHVKGHSGHPENERCDELAVSAYQKRQAFSNEREGTDEAIARTADQSVMASSAEQPQPTSNGSEKGAAASNFNLAVPDSLDHPMLQVLIEAATVASLILRARFGQALTIESKNVAELVTDADITSEKAIVEIISRRYPDHAILAEERESTGNLDGPTWIIDPLDGTNNFAHQIPHFAVSIAFSNAGNVECGIVVNPQTHHCYLAVFGQGAWHNARRMQVDADAQLDQSLVGVGFYYDRGAMMQATLQSIALLFSDGIHGIRRFGTASLDLAAVADGLFGGFFEYQLKPWDCAAGQLLVRESGGLVTDCDGKELPATSSTSILAATPSIHAKMLPIIQPAFDALH
jgi:myo-inositol-1(or 4)-monophosphatase